MSHGGMRVGQPWRKDLYGSVPKPREVSYCLLTLYCCVYIQRNDSKVTYSTRATIHSKATFHGICSTPLISMEFDVSMLLG